MVGFGFKISAVPFHFWAPDTYEGAPSPVAAFLSTASKIGGFVGLLVLMFRAFPEVADSWRPAFAVLAVLTMTFGNLIALRQQHIIRLLAYSGIAQSGYVLVTFAIIEPGNASLNEQALQSAIIYLAIYAVMDLGAFAAAVAFARKGGSYFISDYAGLWSRSPVLATLMTGFLLSLAGVPPMAGAWAKLFVFLAAIEAENVWLAAVMGINAVIGAWYYLAVVKKMYFDPVEVDEPVEVPFMLRVAMGVAAVVLVAAFIYPPLITNLAEESAFLSLVASRQLSDGVSATRRALSSVVPPGTLSFIQTIEFCTPALAPTVAPSRMIAPGPNESRAHRSHSDRRMRVRRQRSRIVPVLA